MDYKRKCTDLGLSKTNLGIFEIIPMDIIYEIIRFIVKDIFVKEKAQLLVLDLSLTSHSFYNIIISFLRNKEFISLNDYLNKSYYFSNKENEIYSPICLQNCILYSIKEKEKIKLRKYELKIITNPLVFKYNYEEDKKKLSNIYKSGIIWKYSFILVNIPMTPFGIRRQVSFYKKEGNWTLFELLVKIINFYMDNFSKEESILFEELLNKEYDHSFKEYSFNPKNITKEEWYNGFRYGPFLKDDEIMNSEYISKTTRETFFHDWNFTFGITDIELIKPKDKNNIELYQFFIKSSPYERQHY